MDAEKGTVGLNYSTDYGSGKTPEAAEYNPGQGHYQDKGTIIFCSFYGTYRTLYMDMVSCSSLIFLSYGKSLKLCKKLFFLYM